MDAVGDVVDRHLVGQEARPGGAQQPPRHVAMDAAHAVDVPAQPHREARHGEAVGIVARAAELEESLPGQAQPRLDVGEVAAHQALAEAIVPGGDAGVRGEDRGGAHHLARLVERQPALSHQPRHAFERRERGVALVDVDHGRLDAEQIEDVDAAAAEHDLLAQPHLVVAAVEEVRDGAVLGTVDRQVGVEQIERNVADHRAPHREHDVAAGQAAAGTPPACRSPRPPARDRGRADR